MNYDNSTVMGILIHYEATKEQSNNYSINHRQGIGYTVECIDTLYFVRYYINLFSLYLYRSTSKFYIYVPIIGKCHTSMELKPIYLILAQLYPKKTINLLLFFYIEY